jgi:hypothetical protein
MQLPPDNVLPMWVVCRSPADYPGKFTARCQYVCAGGVTLVAREVMVCDRLITIRRKMIGAGLTRLPRQPDDEPQILEVWV